MSTIIAERCFLGKRIFLIKFSTLTLHFKDIEAPDRCSGDLGPCVLGNFVAI